MPSLDAAIQHVRGGGLLAFPTETVWGLGADATSDEAVARLCAWKGRGADQPLSILVQDPGALATLGFAETPTSRALAAAFWPGPLTIVLPGPEEHFAAGVARADGAVGVRCSPDPTAMNLAQALAEAGVGPLTATSLNRTGEAPIAALPGARALCAADPELELAEPVGQPAPRHGLEAAAPGGDALPSTVVDCTGPTVRVIREGAIAAAELAKIAKTPSDATAHRSITSTRNESSA